MDVDIIITPVPARVLLHWFIVTANHVLAPPSGPPPPHEVRLSPANSKFHFVRAVVSKIHSQTVATKSTSEKT